MKKGFSCLFTGLLCLLAVQISHGQKAFIKVIDQKTSEPVAFCHVCFEGLKTGTPKYGLTDIDGKVANEVKEKSKIVISYVGYITYRDTVQPGQSVEIKLKPSILNMDEVVITGQYTPERADKSIYKIEVINSRLIEQKAAVNMADLLKDQPAMTVSQDGVLGTSLRIQGMSGENVKFLMDGVPMVGRLNGNFDLNQINLYNVDHVEVIKGPMSVIYGSNALAGAINIITKENKTSRLNAVTDAYYESVGQYNINLAVSSCLGKQGFSLQGSRNFFDGYQGKSTGRDMDYKPRRQFLLDGYYFYTSGRIKLKINADYLNELLLDKGPLLPPYFETAFDNHFTTLRAVGYASGSIDLSGSKYINFLASYSWYSRYRQTVFKDLTIPDETPVNQKWAQDTTNMSTLGFRGTFSRNNEKFLFNYQVGVDLNHETGSGEKILNNHQELGDYASFVTLTINPVKQFSIQPGIRVAYNTKYDAPVVYSLSVKYDFLKQLNFRVSMAKGFRAPGIKELYLSFIDINHDITGNPDLKAEKSSYANLCVSWSAEQQKTASSVDLSVFYNYLENKISLARVGSSTSYSYANVSNYISTGFSLDYFYSIHPSLKIQAGLALTGVKGSFDDFIRVSELLWSPDFTISPTYLFNKIDLTLALYYKFSGPVPQLVINVTELGYNITDQHNTLDFTITKGFWNNRVRVSSGIKNIFNVTTIPTTGAQGGGHGTGNDGNTDIGWGRTFFAKLSFQFNKYK